MKRKLLTALLALMLILSLSCPALASNDYDLAYDATGLMDPDFMQSFSSTLSELSDKYGVQLRVDIVESTESLPIGEYAQLFHDQYGYGDTETGKGVLLMLELLPDDTGLAFQNFYILSYGGDELAGAWDAAGADLEEYLNGDLWDSDIKSDTAACESALTAFASDMDSFLGVASSDSSAPVDAGTGFVADMAGILTTDEADDLNSRCSQISRQYECGVYICTVDDYLDYSSDSVYEAAKNIYRDNGLGYGSEKSGVMLLLSMADRDYSLIAYGYGNTAFTDYGKSAMEDEFLDDFRYDDWYNGFSDYITSAGDYLSDARSGSPVDIGSGYDGYNGGYDEGMGATAIVYGLGVGCLISLLVCLILKRKMKSAVLKYDAEDYIPSGGVILREKQDIYTHTTETRTKIERSSGGGTTVDSSGFSGSSGKF